MKNYLLIGLIMSIFLISACTPEQEQAFREKYGSEIKEEIKQTVVEAMDSQEDIVCNAPYIRHADSCCLDKDDNSICDKDEVEEEVPEAEGQVVEEKEPVNENEPTIVDPDDYIDTKRATPHVELFVMSLCPYAAQMERAIIPVVELLDDEIEFELKFVNYAMHGEEEVEEQLRQYCIQKEERPKLTSYLTCFVDEQDAEYCMYQANVDKGEIQDCELEVDEEYHIYELMNDQSKWGRFPPFNTNLEECQQYHISGSPTLIINGEQYNGKRSPNSLLRSICTSFAGQKPDECAADISDETAQAGLGN
ncbi:MAG: thioredoxin domain-containing protein [Nanoarchaeota archaeon]